MAQHRAPHRPPVRPLLAVALLALVTLAWGGTGSESGWAQANVTNASNARPVGAVVFTHTYAAGPSCSAGASASSAACAGTLISGTVPTGGLSATDVITNSGDIASSSLSQTVAATSCAPVQFANSKNSGNSMVVRYGTSFDTGDTGGPMGGVGYTTLDGASPGGYATSVTAQTQPGGALLSTGTLSGIGVWFKASSGSGGPVFSFGANPDNTTGGSWDRALSMNSSGQLSFVWNTSGSSIGPTTTSGGYANGTWHFAYLTMGGVNLALSLIPQVTLYVDGTQVATTPLASLSPYSAYSGYWHLGYAPTATTGLTTSYFKGTLSNFVVFDGSTFPTPTTVPASASAFATFATNATEWWQLNDNGVTTYAGTLPSVGTGSTSPAASAACKSVDLGWSFASPSGTATAATTSLYALVTSGASAVGAPGPGSSQTATLALGHDAAYNAYVAGLHLYVPMTSTISTLPGSKWPLAFSWTPSATTTIVPTP